VTLERFQAAVAGAVGEMAFLLHHLAPRDRADSYSARERLERIDILLQCIQPMPDLQLRELYLVEVCAWFTLKRSLIAPRLAAMDKAAAVAAEAAARRQENRQHDSGDSAPRNPAGQGGGDAEYGGDGPKRYDEEGYLEGSERDSGLHRRTIRYLEAFIAAKNIQPDAVGGWMRIGNRSRISIKHRALVEEFIFQHAPFFVTLARERVDMILSAMVMRQREARRAEILATVTGRPSTERGVAMLARWLRAMTGRDDAADLGVMRHFMWQVKRLNTEKTVAWDMMPVFSGPQGTGKSTGIRQLCSPFQELFLSIKAAHLTDDRSFEALSDYAIGFWGEMAGGNKAEIAALKHTITAPDVNYRELGGHNHNLLSRRMAFIADANEDVADIIADTTGARRYYQIDVPCVVNYAELEQIDPLICWEAISEDDPVPMAGAVHEEVRRRQLDLVHQDTFDAWMETEWASGWPQLDLVQEGVPFGGGNGGGVPKIIIPAYQMTRRDADGKPLGFTLEQIGQRFGQYLRLQRLPSRTSDWLTKRLHQSGWITVRPTAEKGAKRPRYFRLPPTTPEAGADAAPAVPTRGERFGAEPSPAEDHFLGQAPATPPAVEPPPASPPRAAYPPPADDSTFQGGDDEPPF
jgi:hypothetical protein